MKVINVLQDGVIVAKFYEVQGLKIQRLADDLCRTLERYHDMTTEECEETPPKKKERLDHDQK